MHLGTNEFTAHRSRSEVNSFHDISEHAATDASISPVRFLETLLVRPRHAFKCLLNRLEGDDKYRR